MGSSARPPHPLLCEVQILKVVDVFENGLPRVVALCAASQFGKAVEAFLDLRRQAQCKHGKLLCYTCIAEDTRKQGGIRRYLEFAQGKR